MTDYKIGETYTCLGFYGEGTKEICEFKVLALSSDDRIKIHRIGMDYDQWVSASFLEQKNPAPVRFQPTLRWFFGG